MLYVFFSKSKQELPFREHDECVRSLNRGNYLEMRDLLSQYDLIMDKHF